MLNAETEWSATQYLTIGELAKQSNVTVRTLRYYEEMDLISPEKRTASRYRLYSDRTIKRVKAIQSLQDLNYSLEEILVVLGPASRTGHFNKVEQVNATRQSLELIQACLEDRLSLLTQMKADVATRLGVLHDACAPCLQKEPATQCQETCHHRAAHID
jgi:MerR family copper efflux transcriptional regulator